MERPCWIQTNLANEGDFWLTSIVCRLAKIARKCLAACIGLGGSIQVETSVIRRSSEASPCCATGSLSIMEMCGVGWLD